MRVVVAGPGTGDGARAVVALARALRVAGAEVVHTGGGGSPAQLAATLVQEDADALGLAGSSGALLAEVLGRAADQGADDVAGFLIGAVGSEADGADLPESARAFPPGAAPDDVVGWLRTVGAGS